MNPADIHHRHYFIGGETVFCQPLAQGFHRNGDADTTFLGIRTVGTCLQSTTFCVSLSSLGGSHRWG